MINQVLTAHANMSAADEAFSDALVKRYGKNAGDARYQYQHKDAQIQQLAETFRAAGLAYSNACQAQRESHDSNAKPKQQKESTP